MNFKYLIPMTCLLLMIQTNFVQSEDSESTEESETQKTETQPVRRNVSRGQKIDTGSIKERYWAAGNADETRVIQNRAYVKNSRLEFGLFYGATSTDPFVSVQQFGGSLGFYFSEQLGLRALYWKHFSSKSSAHIQFDEQVRGAQVVLTNHPKSFMGGELVYSPLYGKLSLLGKMIIYYDFYLLAGAGVTSTERGNYFTPLVGLGQHVFLTHWMTLNMNYRMTYYKELVGAKNRTRLDDVVNLGVNFLLF